MFKNFTLASIFSIIIIGLFVGVIFVYADWTAPLSSPPECVAGNPGCDAPINTGSSLQNKAGSLGISGILDVLSDSFFRSNVNVTGNINAGGDVGGSRLCIGADCKSLWPSSASISWADITGKPAGFADNIDDVGAAGGLSGSGTANRFAVWSGVSSLGMSSPVISDNGETIGINNVSYSDAFAKLLVSGGALLVGNSPASISGLQTDSVVFQGRLGVLTNSPPLAPSGSAIKAGGTIESTSGGFKFPDGTTQTTAAGGSYNAGTNLSLTGTTFNVSNSPTFSGALTVQGNTTLGDASGDVISVNGQLNVLSRTNFGAGNVRIYKCPKKSAATTFCFGQLSTESSCATYSLAGTETLNTCTATNIYIE